MLHEVEPIVSPQKIKFFTDISGNPLIAMPLKDDKLYSYDSSTEINGTTLKYLIYSKEKFWVSNARAKQGDVLRIDTPQLNAEPTNISPSRLVTFLETAEDMLASQSDTLPESTKVLLTEATTQAIKLVDIKLAAERRIARQYSKDFARVKAIKTRRSHV